MSSTSTAPVARALYRSLLEVARDFRTAGLPLVGVNRIAAAELSCTGEAADAVVKGSLVGSQALRALFRGGRSAGGVSSGEGLAVDDGLLALRALRQQFRVLQGADAEATQALKQWTHLLAKTGSSLDSVPVDCVSARLSTVACAIEEAAFDLSIKTAPFAPQLLHSSADEDYGDVIDVEVKIAAAQQRLDELAQEVRDYAPAVFSDNGGLPESRIDQVHAVNEVLFRRHKYKSPPVEWVYDGFRPLNLSDVVLQRGGIPILIAIVYQSIARRLRIPLSLCQATDTKPNSGMGTSGSSLPPDPDKWLLFIRPDSKEPPFFVDPSRSGDILSIDASRQRYPQVEIPDDACINLSGFLKVCVALTRTVVVAHQRRGESEAVASWLYQLLALSPDAQEWEFMLAS